MESWLVPRLLSGFCSPGLSSGWSHCGEFLDKIVYSHDASLHPGVYKGTDELRESSFNMTRGEGGEDIEGALRKFLHTRRGALKKLLG